MSARRVQVHRIIAISPTSKGVGYAIIEGPVLIEYGIKYGEGPEKNKQCLRQLEQLLRQYYPTILVVEDTSKKDCRRSERVRRLIAGASILGLQHDCQVQVITKEEMHATFPQSRTRHEVATAVTEIFPELRRRLPPQRKFYATEDVKIAFFAAVALAVTASWRGLRK